MITEENTNIFLKIIFVKYGKFLKQFMTNWNFKVTFFIVFFDCVNNLSFWMHQGFLFSTAKTSLLLMVNFG